MQDVFLMMFGWITELLKRPVSMFLEEGSEEFEIIERFKDGWGKRDTIELLKSLDAEYGDKAGQAVEKYISLNIKKDWAKTGEAQAREGKEIEDFIRLLWEPLKEQGFEYTTAKENGRTTFRVTKCPVFMLAERTGMHKWLYHLACSTDFHSACAFSPKIGFDRTKTLMEGNECCDHQYYYRG